MKQYLEILEKCSLFENIERQDILSMLDCQRARVAKFRKKANIMSEGETAGEIGIVLNGTAQIMRVDYFGNRSIVTNVEASELFGESFACAGADVMPVDVVACEDTEVMLLDCHRLTCSCCNACSFHQQIIFNLMKVVARKNLVFHQKIEILSKRSTREKLMTYLMQQAQKHGSSIFQIPYDRQELADYLEVERSGLSAEISKLRKEGIIESRKNIFRLL